MSHSPIKNETDLENEASFGVLHRLRLNDHDRRELRDLIADAAAADDDVRGLLEHIDDELSASASIGAFDAAGDSVEDSYVGDHLQDVAESCDNEQSEDGPVSQCISIRMADRYRDDETSNSSSSKNRLLSVMRFGHHERGCEASQWRQASLQQTTSCGGRLKLRVQLREGDERREEATSNDITFMGSRLAGIDEHSSYYLLMPPIRRQTDAADEKCATDEQEELVLEAHPLHHWYTFRAEQRYNSLSAEQAEAEFARRDSILNYFSLMASCRAPTDAAHETPDSQRLHNRARGSGPSALRLRIGYRTRRIRRTATPGSHGTTRQPRVKTSKSSKIKSRRRRRRPRASQYSDNASTSNEDDEDEEFDDAEDSVGVMSSSSSDDDDELARDDEEQERQVTMGSVADEGGLAEMLLSSDSDDPDSNLEHHNTNGEVKNQSHQQLDGRGAEDGEFSRIWDQFDSANESNESLIADMNETLGKGSRKRKLNYTPNISRLKRRKLYASSPVANSPSSCGITVDAVKRYLLRKPICVKDLLRKFKPKKTGLSKEETEELLMLALAELNPDIEEISGVTHYSLDSGQ